MGTSSICIGSVYSDCIGLESCSTCVSAVLGGRERGVGRGRDTGREGGRERLKTGPVTSCPSVPADATDSMVREAEEGASASVGAGTGDTLTDT